MDNEAHICNTDNGHAMSSDCWCEPTDIRIVINVHKVPVLVVFHVDTFTAHRALIIGHRNLCINEPYSNNPDAGWITRALNSLFPPPERKE